MTSMRALLHLLASALLLPVLGRAQGIYPLTQIPATGMAQVAYIQPAVQAGDLISSAATGTTAQAECLSKLNFVTLASGQDTGFIAGPTPANAGTFTFDSTVDNVLTLTDQFSSAAAGNNNTLRQMVVIVYR